MFELEKGKETGCCGSNGRNEDGAMCFRRAIRELMDGIPVTRKAWNKSDSGLADKYLALLDGERFDKESGEIRVVDNTEPGSKEYVLTREDAKAHDWVYAAVCTSA